MLLRQENYRCTQHSEYWLLRCRLSVPDFIPAVLEQFGQIVLEIAVVNT